MSSGFAISKVEWARACSASRWPKCVLAALAIGAHLCCAMEASAAGVAVQDDAGRLVSLPAPARRIVSLAPHLTELIADVGAFSTLVGVSAFSDFPAAAARLPQVGSARGADIERIALLKPDLVVAWTSGSSPVELDALERLGIPVFRSEPRTMDGVASSLERLGVLTGHASEGRIQSKNFTDRARRLAERYGTRAPIRVFYQVWDAPLMTVGGEHLISHVMALCGGRNIFGMLNVLAPTVDRETAVLANPELIIAASNEGGTPAGVARWNDWPQVDAVRKHHLLVLDPAVITRQTPRILDGAQIICEALDTVRTEKATPGK